jgi:predicted nucleic acid-binding protein
VILVDTSMWVDHLRRPDDDLKALLEKGLVCVHPVVTGELALGSIRDRQEFLTLLDALARTRVATEADVRHLVEARRLHGRGLGYGDAHLLASTLITPDCRLWTRDEALGAAAAELGVGVRR